MLCANKKKKKKDSLLDMNTMFMDAGYEFGCSYGLYMNCVAFGLDG